MRVPSTFLPMARRMRDSGIFYCRKVRVYSCELGKNSLPGKPNSVRTHVATSGEVDALTSGGREGYKEEWHRRLADGNVCIVAEKDGKIAGYAWVMRTATRIIEVNSTFDVSRLPESAFMHNVNVFEEFRQHGVFGVMIIEVKRWAQENGVKVLYSAAARDNVASRRGHASAGFDEGVALIRYMKILGLESKKIRALSDVGRSVADAIS